MVVSDEGLPRWAARHWPDVDWDGSQARLGAFHHVLLSRSGPVLRVAVGADHALRVDREVAIAQVVSGLGLSLEVPAVLAGPVGDATRTAVLISRVPGDEEPDRPWGADLAGTYRSLLDDLGGVEADGLLRLPPPRSWCGGSDWPDVVRTVTRPFPADLRRLAARSVAAVLEMESEGRPCFVHGDLGPHNILWTEGRATSLIDFDHACVGDAAIDLAPLVGRYGAAAVAPLVGSRVLDRAMTHRATLSLQVAAAAQLVGHRLLRDHALGNFVSRAGAGTLREPARAWPASGAPST